MCKVGPVPHTKFRIASNLVVVDSVKIGQDGFPSKHFESSLSTRAHTKTWVFQVLPVYWEQWRV